MCVWVYASARTCICVEIRGQHTGINSLLRGWQVRQQAVLSTGAFCFLSPAWWLCFTTAAFVTPSPELWRSNVSALRAPGFTWDGPCCPWGDKAQSIHQVPSLPWKKNMAVVKVSETPSNLYPADSVLLAKTEMPLKWQDENEKWKKT